MQRPIVSKPLESERIEVPLSIQTYLWGQTSFFLKPNLHEKKSFGHACVAFEKIICENRVGDLPPNLSRSMNTIPRWHFVQGALPFVLHCCAALLSNRTLHGNTEERLTTAETKLLYTLHWILLNAPNEVENYSGKLYPLHIVELFIQSIVPYVNCIHPQDLTIRLQEGYEIWKALWEFRSPPLRSFTASVVLERAESSQAKKSIVDFQTSFFDLAVLKCLMLPDWHDEGRVWGLQYVLNYLENEEKYFVEMSNRNSSCSTTDAESEAFVNEKALKPAHAQPAIGNVNKLKRFYGLSGPLDVEKAFGQRKGNSKDGHKEIRASSSSSVLEAIAALSNLKSDIDEPKTEVANGAKEFLDENGSLRKTVFLDVVCQIANRSSNARVCNLLLTILEQILEKYVIKPRDAEKDSSDNSTLDLESEEGVNLHSDAIPIAGKFSLLLYSQKALGCTINVMRALGCSYGCGKGIRGVVGKNLRAKTLAMLSRLCKMDAEKFKAFLQNYTKEEDVEVVTNFLHALLGFCTMTLESKSSGKKMSEHFKEKSGVVGIVIDSMFPAYVTRLIEFNLEEISNVALFSQVRQLAKYVKENAGGTFYRVVFRGLLKAAGTPRRRFWESFPRDRPYMSQSFNEGDTSTLPRVSVMEKMTTPRTQRKTFFSKFSKSVSSTEGSPVGTFDSPPDVLTTPLSRRKAMKRIKKGSTLEESLSVEDEIPSVGSLDRRRKSIIKKFFPKTNRKKADEIFGIETRKSGGVSYSSFRRQSNVEYTSIPVNVQEIRDGMMKFSMLLESCLPGSVPDHNIIAGILELKAPAIARGALLVECAHFVHRCNKGEWPSWLLSSHPSTRRGKGGFGALVRNAIAVSRRNVRIKHEAGLLFYKWAVAIGQRLEQIESRISSDSIKEGSDGVEGNRVVEEDFLDEGTLNKNTRKCPYALKMIACQLLLEITAFLRESHSSLARKAENQRMRNKSIAFSRQNRRPTQKVFPIGGEHRDAVTSGPAERLRQGNPSILTPVVSLIVPIVNIPQDAAVEKKVPAPVIKVEGGPAETENDEKTRKRFSSLFSNSEKKRKLHKPEAKVSDRKASPSTAPARMPKKSPKVHRALGRVTSDASDTSDIEEEEVSKFPWLKAVTMVSGLTDFTCDHRDVCKPGCIRRQTQSCSKFMVGLKTIYSKSISTRYGSRKFDSEKGRQCKLSTKELTLKQKEQRDKILITYISEKVRNLFNCPMSVLIKGAVVMEPNLFVKIIPLAWELLLSPLEELVSTAAAVFLVASLHLKENVEKILQKELSCGNCENQVKSLTKYCILWRSRYYVWPRMEAGAKYVLKIPLPKLDFTLPSPPVGSSAPPVPDCPWDPNTYIHITKNEQELTREDKEKDMHEASKLEKEKKKQRNAYNFTNTSISLEASTPAESEEGRDAAALPITTDFWPPAMSSAVPRIVGLLDNSSVTSSQVAVSEVAKTTLWECLVDDPMLFFRTFFEDITKPNKQKELVFLLSKLLIHIPTLPPNAGVILFNHLVGVILYYSRRHQPCSEGAIALILSSLLWKIVPSVPKLYLKDLKYSAKKEHCERTLMVTANTPGTKKVVVTCPEPKNNTDNEKLTVREDMSFGHILQYCTAKWSLDNPHYCLLDAKSGHILEEKHLVRDVYAFKKGFPYPQLKLQVYNDMDAYVKRQDQAFIIKMAEVGRLYLTLGILESVQTWHHVSFLHSELSKQIAFPRKALDVDFGLYEGGFKGTQLCSMDGIHKRMWIKLLSKLFDSMNSCFPWGDDDLHLFMNVINGALLLQCEDTSMLRFCLATLINAAIKFTDIFAFDGYYHILPTLALLYSHHENNEIVCTAVEFIISQFYILHQKPFILQFFASIEPILLTENVNKMPEHSDEIDESNMILPKCFFAILSSLENDVPDILDVLSLVDVDGELKPLDSCYEGKLEENESKLDTAIRLCVTVVACSPESVRATQMLVVLSSMLPFYLEYVRNNANNDKKKCSRDEPAALQSLHRCVQVLLKSCTSLRRPFLKIKELSSVAKRRTREGSTGSVTSFTTSQENVRLSRMYPDEDRDSESIDQQFKPFLNKFSTQDEGEQVLDSLYEFRTPRNAILIIASELISTSKRRLQELNLKNSGQTVNLALDNESIQSLCNIAHTLLKLSLTDTVSLELTGLQKFMLEALPNIDWSAEETIPALNLILKRINSTFTKITDKPDLMNFFWPYPLLLHRSEHWNVTVVLLKGLYLTISKQTAVTALPFTKAIVATCMRLVVREQSYDYDFAGNMYCDDYPAPSIIFCQLVVKLAARLMFTLRDKYSLKDLCGGTIEFGDNDRTLRVFVHILLPLCIRLGVGDKNQPRASKVDVSYAVSCFLFVIVTPFIDSSSSANRLSTGIMMNYSVGPSSPFFHRSIRKRHGATFSQSIFKAAYLGLKVMIVCFPGMLSNEWCKISSALKEAVAHGAGTEFLFEFLEFIILHRSPLFLLLLPILRSKIAFLQPVNSRAASMKQDLLARLKNPTDPPPSKKEWMRRFIVDLGILTGSEQRDKFFCTNPDSGATRSNFTSIMHPESLSDSESALIIHPTVHSETHEGIMRNADSSRDANKSARKTIKKKVSFDKGKTFNVLEEDIDVDANFPLLKSKRSLPRQEIAVDLESPVSSKRLSDKYQVQTSKSPSEKQFELTTGHENTTCVKEEKGRRGVEKNEVNNESKSLSSLLSSDGNDNIFDNGVKYEKECTKVESVLTRPTDSEMTSTVQRTNNSPVNSFKTFNTDFNNTELLPSKLVTDENPQLHSIRVEAIDHETKQSNITTKDSALCSVDAGIKPDENFVFMNKHSTNEESDYWSCSEIDLSKETVL